MNTLTIEAANEIKNSDSSMRFECVYDVITLTAINNTFTVLHYSRLFADDDTIDCVIYSSQHENKIHAFNSFERRVSDFMRDERENEFDHMN